MRNIESNVLLQVRDLHTYFYTNEGVVKAVDGVDLSIRKGEVVGLVGESGCGKSVTALSIIRLLQEPPGRIVKGEIIFENRDLLRLNKGDMQRIRGNSISMVFQEPMTSLNPVLRAGEQVAEAIRKHQGVSRREALDRAIEMLRRVGIPDPDRRAKEYPHQMSGGMRQRVMIGMALSCNPKIMIADEPTTALDVTIQAQILDLMNRLKEDVGASILLITHDLGVIAEIAQVVAVMYAGKIVEHADLNKLLSHPKHPYTIGLLNSLPKLSEPVPEDRILQFIPGVVPSLADLPEGCSFHKRCFQGSDLCRQKVPSLSEVGLGHYVRCFQYGSG